MTDTTTNDDDYKPCPHCGQIPREVRVINRALRLSMIAQRMAQPEEVRAPFEPIERELTCDKCHDASECSCAFDWYNTNGDCLASK